MTPNTQTPTAPAQAGMADETVWLLSQGDDGLSSQLVVGWQALRRAWLDAHRHGVDHDNLDESDLETLSLLEDDDEWSHDDQRERFSLSVNYEGDWVRVTRVDDVSALRASVSSAGAVPLTQDPDRPYADIPTRVGGPFKAMAQGKTDYTLDAFSVNGMLTIGASEEAVYITKAQAAAFYDLVPPAPLTAQGGDARSQIEALARSHGTGGWQTLDSMVSFGLAVHALAAQPAAQQGAPVGGLRDQHDRDSAELRRLCEARDHARRERDAARAEIAGLESSVGHLSAMADGQTRLVQKAVTVMKALHESATPIDGPDMDACIPGQAFHVFVDGHAELMHALASGPQITTPQPAQALAPMTDEPSVALVPVEPTDAILRPFYECPPDELRQAWSAALTVARVAMKRTPQASEHADKGDGK